MEYCISMMVPHSDCEFVLRNSANLKLSTHSTDHLAGIGVMYDKNVGGFRFDLDPGQLRCCINLHMSNSATNRQLASHIATPLHPVLEAPCTLPLRRSSHALVLASWHMGIAS
jgi:hypothetical protein